MILEENIREKFRTMGADVAFRDVRGREIFRWESERLRKVGRTGRGSGRAAMPRSPTIDVERIRRRERFVIDVFDDPGAQVRILDLRPDARHLLLMVRSRGGVSKYLMGHDERHWFVAAIPEDARVRNVPDAMEALKPAGVRSRQAALGAKAKDRNRRLQTAYVRQGEWFFLPIPEMEADDCDVHRREPISHGRNKPHLCEELVRKGGRSVWVHPVWAPSGISDEERRAMTLEHPERAKARWEPRVADAEVYVRGYVRHPDHKTVHLKVWHRVLPNTEERAAASTTLRFLD